MPLDNTGRLEDYSDRLGERAELDTEIREAGAHVELGAALSGIALALVLLTDTLDARLGELGDALRGAP